MALLRYVVLPLIRVLAVAGAIVGSKAWRRRRRRSAESVSARFAGGWREITDHARDLGVAVSGVTRREQSLVLAGVGVREAAPALARRADSHVFGPRPPEPAAAAAYWQDVDAFKPVYRDRFDHLTNTDPSFNEAHVSDTPIRPKRLSATEIRGITEHLQQRREASLSVDDAVDRIMQALANSGELADTYVFFASDNGLMLGEHRIRGGKRSPYEVANRVPLLVRGPGIPAGAVVRQVAGQIDFAPTVLSTAGLPVPSSVDGVSLLGLLRNPGGAGPSRPGVLLEATAKSSTVTPPWNYRGVVDGHWKYVERATGRKELYDLEADPYELVNVAGRSAYAQRQQQLAQLLATLRECEGAQCR